MVRFLPLTVTDVRRDTRDAVVVTLKPEDASRADFTFVQGQYLTFRKHFDDEEVRRSYSICSGLDDGDLRVAIKRVDGGLFSTWANEKLVKGDVLHAMAPMGMFHTPLDPQAVKSYLAFAAGSGITPVLSLLKTVLVREPKCRFTLVYANRSANSIMFREELEDLKNGYLGRLSMLHILESQSQDMDLFAGRIDAGKCDRLFQHLIDIKSIDTAFICGPEPMMLVCAAALKKHHLRDDQIKFELFASSRRSKCAKKIGATAVSNKDAECEVTVVLDGTSRVFKMPKRGKSLLDAALENSVDAPYACKAGVCSTCRAMIVEGSADMEANHALEDYEVKRGYVLTCQCTPLTDKIVVSFDQ